MTEDLRRFQHRRFARAYADISHESDRRGGVDHRRRLVAGIRGTVIEVGAGNGLNFAHYPSSVDRVLAVEPDDTLRALAVRAASGAPVPVEVVAGHADDLPAGDASFDVAVTSLVLCSVPSLSSALAEIRRVLVPGGRLHYYEHVRSGGVRGLMQDAVRPLWTRMAGGCHLNRRTGEAFAASGLVVDEEERFRWQAARLSPALDHVLGRAHTPP